MMPDQAPIICGGCFEDIDPANTDAALTCPKCGAINTPVASVPDNPISPARVEKSLSVDGESAYFAAGSVIVTRSRFIVGAQTFAIANFTSVLALEIPPRRGLFLLLLVVLIPPYFGASFAIPIDARLIVCAGLAVLAVGLILIFRMKPSYAIQITTAAGEQCVCPSKNGNQIKQIVDALNRAIVDRG